MKQIFFIGLSLLTTFFMSAQNSAMKLAKDKLGLGKSITDILTDPQFDSIRTETEFRELIKSKADQKTVTYTTDKEPGTKINIKGQIVDQSDQPVKNILVYVYQTDTRGWYGSDRVHFNMNEGDRKHARLFAYLLTNEKGEFEFNTIQPHGYPQSDLPAHIHFEVYNKEKMLAITELLFDDDERLQGDIRERSEREKFLIAKPVMESGKKVYHYRLNLNK